MNKFIKYFTLTYILISLLVNCDDLSMLSKNEWLELNGKPLMKITANEVEYESGSTYDFGIVAVNITDVTFTIENNGDIDLLLNINISGDTQFSIRSNATSPVSPNKSTTFTIRFNTILNGSTYNATITINNNSDNNPYIIYVTGSSMAS